MLQLLFVLFLVPGCLVLKGQTRFAPADSLLNVRLPSRAMREDLALLKRALQETHPGLYRYNSREEIDCRIDSIDALLTDSLPFYDYNALLAFLVSGIRCAHTHVYPSADWQNRFASQQKLFPFQLFSVGEQVYIVLNRSTDTLVRPGYQLLTINGLSIDSVRRRIFSRFWSDGYILSAKERVLDGEFFSIFYYWWVARPDSFQITCKTPEGKLLQIGVPALYFTDIKKNTLTNRLNEEVMKIYGPRNQRDQAKRWRLTIHKDSNTAVMVIRSFGGGKDARDARDKMHSFMKESMKEIRRQHIGNLVIDLRYNPGGWDGQGEELLTWLIHAPTLYYRRQHTVTDSSSFLRYADLSAMELAHVKEELVKEADGTFTLKEKYNESLRVQDPQRDAYTGRLYFLINGGSVSTTAEFTAVAKTHHLGLFIGEETGGNYTGGNASSFINLTLPHTGIRVGIPLVYYENAVDRPLEPGRGTMPDYVVPDKIEEVLKGVDTQLDFVYSLIMAP